MYSLPDQVSGWNTGQLWVSRPLGTDVGFSPDWCLSNDVNPSFEIYAQFQAPENLSSPNVRYGDYYDHIDQCAAQGLPISFVLSNDLADCFRTVNVWRWSQIDLNDPTVPEDSHPWRVDVDAAGELDIVRQVSVFSPGVKSFYEMGELVGDWLAQLQDRYPNPPRILLCDNNEAGIADKPEDFIADHRCPQFYQDMWDTMSPPEFQNAAKQRLEWGMRLRWAEFRRGLRSKLSQSWRDALVFMAYGGFGQLAMKAGQISTNELPFYSPAIGHEGISCSVGYISNGRKPDIVRCPMVEACNVKWSQEQYRDMHGSDMVIEPHFYWPPDRTKWPIDQCQGMLRGTAWIIRSQSHRVYCGSTKTVAEYGDVMLTLRDVLAEVRNTPMLANFWQNGTLLENRWLDDTAALNESGFGHPYNGQEHKALPPEFSPATLADRWYIQPTSADIRASGNRDHWDRPLNHTAPVNCLAICLEINGEYLTYATAPRGALTGVTISPCPDGPTPRFEVTVDVPVEGAFWHTNNMGVSTQVI